MWAKQKRAQERPKADTGLAHFTGEETEVHKVKRARGDTGGSWRGGERGPCCP